jgi:hypothetical protein
VLPAHHLKTNEKGKEAMPTTTEAEFSALLIGGEANPSSGLSPKSDPSNVICHQGHLRNTALKVATAGRHKGTPISGAQHVAAAQEAGNNSHKASLETWECVQAVRIYLGI